MKKIQNVKAFLFDFDGTLVDTMGGYADVAARLISGKIESISFDEARTLYLETSGVPFFQQLEIIIPGHGENGRLATLFEEKKQTGLFSSDFSDDARDTVSRLRNAGLLAGISSNNQQELIDRFVATGDLEFDAVMGYSPGFEKGKDHFDRFLETFSLTSEMLLFVGDSLKDAEKAEAAGIRFIGLTGTFGANDFKRKNPGIYVVDSLKEIANLCEL